MASKSKDPSVCLKQLPERASKTRYYNNRTTATTTKTDSTHKGKQSSQRQVNSAPESTATDTATNKVSTKRKKVQQRQVYAAPISCHQPGLVSINYSAPETDTDSSTIVPDTVNSSTDIANLQDFDDTASKDSSEEGDKNYTPCPCGIDPDQSNLQCSFCKVWWHSYCLGLTDWEISAHREHEDLPYRCPRCTIKVFKGNLNQLIKRQTQTSKQKVTTTHTEAIREHSQESQAKHHSEFTDPKQYSAESHSSATETARKVVIIDNIEKPELFKTRPEILREVKKYKKKVAIDYAYSLPAGGVALHVRSEEDTKALLEDWPSGSFESNKVKPHRPRSLDSTKTVYVHNIDTSLSVAELTSEIQKNTNQSEITVTRVYKSHSGGNSLPLITVTANSELITSFLCNGIRLFNKTYNCKPKRILKFIRCYNCQGFGHISSRCKKNTICNNCGQHHTNNSSECNLPPYCINCGESHQASSKDCNRYQSRIKVLRSRSLFYAKYNSYRNEAATIQQ